jgi:carbon storage regulator
MLVLSRRIGEEIVIDGNIHVTVISATGRQVRLGITAPAAVPIARQELFAKCPHSAVPRLGIQSGRNHPKPLVQPES